MAPRDTIGNDRDGTFHPNLCVFQRTLRTSISCSGTGLHSGQKITLTLHPAEPGTGIVFRRSDVAGGGAEIPCRWDAVVDTRLCTVIADDGGVLVGTVEHLMAALAGMGIDNLLIEVNGPEVPVMDGSSAPFVFLVECAGIVEQDTPRQTIEILKPISVAGPGKTATLLPSGGCSFSFEIDFPNRAIGRQSCFFDMQPDNFREQIAKARTFGFEKDVAQLRSMGLARGGSLENAVVVSDDRILNEEGLRYRDEFVRHKVLDSIGDLALAGYRIQGHFHGFKSGHALNNQLLRALFADRAAWRFAGAFETAIDHEQKLVAMAAAE